MPVIHGAHSASTHLSSAVREVQLASPCGVGHACGGVLPKQLSDIVQHASEDTDPHD